MTGTGPRRTSSSDESRPLLSHHDTEELLTARYHYGTNNGTDLNNNAAVIGGQNNDNVDGNNRDGDDDGLDDFNFDDSPDNPQNWPTPFKWSVVALLAMTAFSVTFNCISLVPLAPSIIRSLSPSDPSSPPGAPSSSSGGISQKSASVLLVTIWELGEAAGPLLIAPLSELFGRYPTLNISNILLIFFTILTATATSIPTLILARCLTGLAVASNVLNPAIVGDMFPSDQRGSPMSMIFVAPLVGGALGPAIASAVAESVGWRNVVWGAAGLSTACEVLFLCLFKETYKVAIIKRRLKEKTRLADQANALLGGGGGGRRQRGHKRSYSEMSIGSKRDAWRKLRDSVLRPFLVVFGSGLLMALSLLGSVTFSFFYVISVTLPEILDGYGLEGGVKGLCFMGFTVGSFVAVLICNAFLDRIYIALRDRDLALTQPCSPDDCIPKEKPEYRLPLTIIGAFSMPFAISFYGWVAHLSLPLPFLLIACALIGANAMLTLIPLMAYVVDAFGLFSASAMTGVIVSRCLMGTFLPLTTAPLVDAFGYGWGFMVFGAVSMALAPISVVVFRYGERWRSFCKYSRAE